MKIAISGSANLGKTTFINDMIQKWPSYKVADKSYREIAKNDPKVKLNRDGNKESQEIIMNALCDQAMAYTKDDNVFFDRCVFDNLAYSIWLNAREVGGVDDTFISKSIKIAKETSKLYDIIFHIPLLDKYPVEIVPDELRDTDPVFREEIAAILASIYKTYHEKTPIFFDPSDCPAVIEIFGSREERVQLVSFYIGMDGKLETRPLLNDM